MFGPGYIQASTTTDAQRHAQTTAHQVILEGLARLVADSHGVIAVHQRGASPFVEVVLWLEDSTPNNVIDKHELIVVGHSRVLRTVTVYQMTKHGGLQDQTWEPQAPELGERTFCDAWRVDPSIRPRVIGTGISDMRIERIDGASATAARYAITLTWVADSADGADEATLFVDAIELGAAIAE